MFGHGYLGAGYFGSGWFGPGAADAPEPPDDDIAIGAGSIWDWKKRLAEDDRDRSKRWQQRRKQLERISNLIDGIKEELPSDVPEAQVARKAEVAVEKAADRLTQQVPMPAFDWRSLADEVRKAESALRQAEQALTRYELRKRRELDEQDDEDVLLLLG